jgi:hypothetical protein
MGKSARQRRAARITQTLPTLDELTEHHRQARRHRWQVADRPFSVDPRADDAFAESNYRVIKTDLEGVADMEIDYRIDAWPGGTILTVRADDALALRAVQQ